MEPLSKPVRLNFLERQIDRFSPAWGAQRLAERMARAEIEVMARRYDIARQGRRTDGWYATGGAPNEEAFSAMGLSIRRSRDLCRNNEWARNARRKWVGHSIGTGIVPRADVDAKAAKKAAMAA